MSSLEMMARQSLEKQTMRKSGRGMLGRYYAELIFSLARVAVIMGHDLEIELREIHAEHMKT